LKKLKYWDTDPIRPIRPVFDHAFGIKARRSRESDHFNRVTANKKRYQQAFQLFYRNIPGGRWNSNDSRLTVGSHSRSTQPGGTNIKRQNRKLA
jgi:hypothetical protein